MMSGTKHVPVKNDISKGPYEPHHSRVKSVVDGTSLFQDQQRQNADKVGLSMGEGRYVLFDTESWKLT